MAQGPRRACTGPACCGCTNAAHLRGCLHPSSGAAPALSPAGLHGRPQRRAAAAGAGAGGCCWLAALMGQVGWHAPTWGDPHLGRPWQAWQPGIHSCGPKQSGKTADWSACPNCLPVQELLEALLNSGDAGPLAGLLAGSGGGGGLMVREAAQRPGGCQLLRALLRCLRLVRRRAGPITLLTGCCCRRRCRPCSCPWVLCLAARQQCCAGTCRGWKVSSC